MKPDPAAQHGPHEGNKLKRIALIAVCVAVAACAISSCASAVGAFSRRNFSLSDPAEIQLELHIT